MVLRGFFMVNSKYPNSRDLSTYSPNLQDKTLDPLLSALVDAKITAPKSGKSRLVDMSRQLTEVLKEYLDSRTDESPWLFPGATGQRINKDTFRERKPINIDTFRERKWHKILKAANVSRRRIHDIRHTYATLLLEQGASLAYVQQQLGHSSISITVDLYGHLVPGNQRHEVDKLDTPRTDEHKGVMSTQG